MCVKPGMPRSAAEVLAAPADEVALGVVVLQLEAGLAAAGSWPGGLCRSSLLPSTMQGTTTSLPASMSVTAAASFSGLPAKLRSRNGSPWLMFHHSPPALP